MSLLIAPIEALTDERLSDSERRVLLALFSFRGKNTNTVWPGLDAIGKRALIKDRARVSKLTSSLAVKGWLTKRKRGFTGCNQYTLIVPESDASLKESPYLVPDTKLAESGKVEPETNSMSALGTNSSLVPDTKYKEQTKEQTKEQGRRADRLTDIADRIIDHLNRTAQKRFRHTKANRTAVVSRLKEGFTEEDCLRVIENRATAWLGTEMDEYLRPSTLFSTAKFEGYLNANSHQRGSGTTIGEHII